jgi:hypothetical protein
MRTGIKLRCSRPVTKSLTVLCLCSQASYESFTEMLPEHECRYGLYDHDYIDIEGCQKSKIVFFAW